MNDHIPEPTKMISDTPRTDDAEYLSYDSEPPQSLEMVDVTFARQLERELNAANAEIERLTNKVAQLYEGAEEAKQRIIQLEEELIDAKGKYAALVADVALYEDRGERIKRLEEAGDVLCENSNPSRWDSPAAAARKLTEQSNWIKAKEAK